MMTSSRGGSPRRPYRRARIAAIGVLATLLVFLPGMFGYSADIPIATVTVGDAPVSVAVNSLSHRVYVANYYGSSVSIIDGASDTVTSTVSTGDFTVPIAVIANPLASPARAYVANFWANTITVIDESTGLIDAAVPSNGVHAGGPRSLALDPSGPTPKLYVAEYGSGLVTILNAETYEQIATVSVGTYPRALGIFSAAGHRRVFVANGGSNTVSIIDGDTNALVGTVATGVAPKAIAVDTATGYAYVTNENDDTVTVIDDNDQFAGTVSVGDRPVGIAVDSSAGRVFVANYNASTVSVLRTSDLSHEATLSVGTSPWAIAFDEGDAKAFVTNYAGSSTSVIDSSLAVQTVPCGTGPYALAVDEGASPHKTYVGNWNSDNVTVIDEPLLPASLSALSTAEAYAAEDAVLVTVDPAAPSGGGTVVVTGTATDTRQPYAAAVTAVFYRVAPATAWERADITSGEYTSDVTWSADLGTLPDGSYDLEVIALDQTGAAAAVSDGGTAVSATSIDGAAAATVDVGTEPVETTTQLTLTPTSPPAPPLLTATVACDEPGCEPATGEVVFEQLLDTSWVAVGGAELVDATASTEVSRSTRGTFRARYLGDDLHLASTSDDLVLSSASGSNSKRSASRQTIP